MAKHSRENGVDLFAIPFALLRRRQKMVSELVNCISLSTDMLPDFSSSWSLSINAHSHAGRLGQATVHNDRDQALRHKINRRIVWKHHLLVAMLLDVHFPQYLDCLHAWRGRLSGIREESGLAQQRYVKSHRNLFRSPRSGPHPGTPHRPIRVTGVGRPQGSMIRPNGGIAAGDGPWVGGRLGASESLGRV
jgi:hypothetical protein